MSADVEAVLAVEPTLEPRIEGADHVDVETVEGTVTLRTFLAGMVSYAPAWVSALYAVRWLFVRLLGMSQEGIPRTEPVLPDDVPFEPGAQLGVFTVARAGQDQFWIGEAVEAHLSAALCVVVEEHSDGRRFHVVTAVHYRRWTGPVYFTVVRPFHHLVVARMAAAGVSPERRVGSGLVNVHERRLDATADRVGAFIDSLGSDDDELWPADPWPPLTVEGPLAVGTQAGHGPVRYVVDAYEPGESIRFAFTEPAGFDGWHRFDLVAEGDERPWIRHVVSLRLSGSARLTWPLLDRYIHDALVEDAFDRAERSVGSTPSPGRWPHRVRAAVWVLARR